MRWWIITGKYSTNFIIFLLMPTTWWQYGLYGLSELTRPHRFGWWTVLLVVVCWLVLWYLFKRKDSEITIEKSQFNVIDRPKRFDQVQTLEQVANLIVRRSWSYDESVPLGVTLLWLQTKSWRSDHAQFLIRLERTLYDPDYTTMISSDETKDYLREYSFFDSLTRSWSAN